MVRNCSNEVRRTITNKGPSKNHRARRPIRLDACSIIDSSHWPRVALTHSTRKRPPGFDLCRVVPIAWDALFVSIPCTGIDDEEAQLTRPTYFPTAVACWFFTWPWPGPQGWGGTQHCHKSGICMNRLPLDPLEGAISIGNSWHWNCVNWWLGRTGKRRGYNCCNCLSFQGDRHFRCWALIGL